MFPPISYDLSFAMKVPSMIRPKGTQGDDPEHAAAVAKAVRVTPFKVRAWLESLVWAPGSSGANLPSSLQGELIHKWAEIDPVQQGKTLPEPVVGDPTFTIELNGSYIALDQDAPPAWIYAAKRLFIGDESTRPRGYLQVDCVSVLDEQGCH